MNSKKKKYSSKTNEIVPNEALRQQLLEFLDSKSPSSNWEIYDHFSDTSPNLIAQELVQMCRDATDGLCRVFSLQDTKQQRREVYLYWLNTKKGPCGASVEDRILYALKNTDRPLSHGDVADQLCCYPAEISASNTFFDISKLKAKGLVDGSIGRKWIAIQAEAIQEPQVAEPENKVAKEPQATEPVEPVTETATVHPIQEMNNPKEETMAKATSYEKRRVKQQKRCDAFRKYLWAEFREDGPLTQNQIYTRMPKHDGGFNVHFMRRNLPHMVAGGELLRLIHKDWSKESGDNKLYVYWNPREQSVPCGHNIGYRVLHTLYMLDEYTGIQELSTTLQCFRSEPNSEAQLFALLKKLGENGYIQSSGGKTMTSRWKLTEKGGLAVLSCLEGEGVEDLQCSEFDEPSLESTDTQTVASNETVHASSAALDVHVANAIFQRDNLSSQLSAQELDKYLDAEIAALEKVQRKAARVVQLRQEINASLGNTEVGANGAAKHVGFTAPPNSN